MNDGNSSPSRGASVVWQFHPVPVTRVPPVMSAEQIHKSMETAINLPAKKYHLRLRTAKDWGRRIPTRSVAASLPTLSSSSSDVFYVRALLSYGPVQNGRKNVHGPRACLWKKTKPMAFDARQCLLCLRGSITTTNPSSRNLPVSFVSFVSLRNLFLRQTKRVLLPAAAAVLYYLENRIKIRRKRT